MKRHAASSGGTGIDLTDEEPSLWAPPTLQKAEAAVRYTGDQPPDYEERLDMLRDLRVWRDVSRFIIAIGEEGATTMRRRQRPRCMWSSSSGFESGSIYRRRSG